MGHDLVTPEQAYRKVAKAIRLPGREAQIIENGTRHKIYQTLNGLPGVEKEGRGYSARWRIPQ